MTGPLVAVVDYGAGNLVSIDQALVAVRAEVRIVRHGSELDARPALLVVPGVGAAAPAMRRLEEAQLVDPIRDWIAAGRPYLGICLGLQLLFEASDEDGAATFGEFAGRARQLRAAPTLPHIGWNQVDRHRDHPAFAGIRPGAEFYFVHSFAGEPAGGTDDPDVLATTAHGGTFVSAIARANVLGVQFHPERSAGDGLRLLANVLGWACGLAVRGPARTAAGAGRA